MQHGCISGMSHRKYIHYLIMPSHSKVTSAGYLLKDTPPVELISATQGTVAGKSFVDPNVTGKLLTQVASEEPKPKHPTHCNFNEREYDVLKLLAHGFPNAVIAQQLYLTEGTVRKFTSEIFAKVGVYDRTQAAIVALRYGFVDLHDLDL